MHALTLWNLALLWFDQPSVRQHRDRNVPSGGASVAGVTGTKASQVVKVTDVHSVLFHHGNRVVDGAIALLCRDSVV